MKEFAFEGTDGRGGGVGVRTRVQIRQDGRMKMGRGSRLEFELFEFHTPFCGEEGGSNSSSSSTGPNNGGGGVYV